MSTLEQEAQRRARYRDALVVIEHLVANAPILPTRIDAECFKFSPDTVVVRASAYKDLDAVHAWQDRFGGELTSEVRDSGQLYWAQKEQSGAPTKEFSEDRFRQLVWTYVREGGQEYRGLAKAVQAEIFDSGFSCDEDTARRALEAFEHADAATPAGREFRFDDVWEMSFTDWTTQYLWCCHAIAWGIGRFAESLRLVETVAVVGGAA